jgi:dephospho-CoA kinase
MLWVGLTGGIASGKSSVARVLQQAGASVVSADQLAHTAIRKGCVAYDDVVRAFGVEMLNADGEIDRIRLGQLVFNDTERRKQLEAILHPHIFEAAWTFRRTLAASHPTGVAIYNAALLIETGTHREMDRVIVVSVDEATQLARLMKRDRLSEAEARRRIAIQMPLTEKLKWADEVIDNRPPSDEVAQAVTALYQRLCLSVPGHFDHGVAFPNQP